MIKILFICHGNICRSPMAEMVLKHLVHQRGLESQFLIDSCGVSREELGKPVYPQARAELARHGIPCEKHSARQLRREEYGEWDHIICMDLWNISGAQRILGGDPENKLSLLMEYTSHPREVDDPWYSDRFDQAYRDILEGCEGLLSYLGY